MKMLNRLEHHGAGSLSLNAFVAAVLAAFLLVALPAPAALAQSDGTVPGQTLGNKAETDFWREIRKGSKGTVSIPDKRAGQLIQSEGDNWRAVRNGPLSKWGGWALFGMIALLALFFAGRGRIAIDKGPSGKTVQRFNSVERMGHWLLATSFIILAISGLNMLYGKYVLLPLIGPDIFAALTAAGKWLHNHVAFAFMVSLVIIFVQWVVHNFPSRTDLVWLWQAGGLFSKGNHPPAKKFNAGQKILFWLVLIFGVSISLSGISLMFPFEYDMFTKTLAFLHSIGFYYEATVFTPMQEMQLSQLWHTIVAFAFIAVILGHIYIGSIGMEGAFAAMGSGQVDSNWAREHHSLWMEKIAGKAESKDEKAAPTAAE